MARKKEAPALGNDLRRGARMHATIELRAVRCSVPRAGFIGSRGAVVLRVAE